MVAQILILLALVATVFAATFFGTRAAISALAGRAILDRPNARSSHAVPTPRGGGLAVVPAVLAGWLAVAQASGGLDTEVLAVLLGAVLLGAVSWLDDLRGLPVLVRLAAQAAAIGTVLMASGEPPVFGGLLPGWADALAAGLVWLWFVNLYNFMDGIDGLAGTETASIGLGIAVVAAVAGLNLEPIAYGLAVAAAAAAFLIWNWQPARVFLGDVGSIPLGFLLGWLLLALARQGLWVPAVLLPLYYLADASLTLVRRAIRRETLWKAHRQHFYQLAVQRGFRHTEVAQSVAVCNGLLIVAAVLAADGAPGPSLLFGAAVVASLIAFLAYAPAPPAGEKNRSA